MRTVRVVSAVTTQGIEILLANVSSLNERSLRFHRKHGFTECGRLRRITTKYGTPSTSSGCNATSGKGTHTGFRYGRSEAAFRDTVCVPLRSLGAGASASSPQDRQRLRQAGRGKEIVL